MNEVLPELLFHFDPLAFPSGLVQSIADPLCVDRFLRPAIFQAARTDDLAHVLDHADFLNRGCGDVLRVFSGGIVNPESWPGFVPRLGEVVTDE